MSNLPFVIQRAKLSAVTDAALGRDVLTSEDPLPMAVTIDPAGYALERKTRITAVEAETLDDN
jgi:hypothetical protein